MAEINNRRSGELMRAAFAALLDKPDGLPAGEVIRRVEQVVPPTPFEAADYPNRPGTRRFEKLVRFFSINTVKAGWLLKQKGVWYLTDEGKAAYEKFTDSEAFMKEAIRLYRVWAKAQPDTPAVPGAAEAEADAPDAASVLEEAIETSSTAIEAYLQAMNPYDFQRLVGGLLNAMGYHVDWIAPPGADGGIDIVAYSDPLGAAGPRMKVQVKRQSGKQGAHELRSFAAVLADDDVGIFVSTGGFTSGAESEARLQQRRKITLLDLGRVVDLWTQHYAKLDEADRALLPLRAVHYLAPHDAGR
jgi:restriction system protein